MAEIGYATLGIIPSFDGFERKLTGGVNGPMDTVGGKAGTTFGNAAGKTAGSRFGSVFKSAAKAGLVGIGALGVGAFALAKDSIAAASDLEESTNKVNQVFGDAAGTVLNFSAKAADALGQTNVQARDAAATFGLFGSIAGLNDRKTAKFATRMTTLASDLASFHNTEPEQAVEALGAALRGEAEPIRSYGVLLDEAALKAEAMRLNLLKPVKDEAKIKSYQISVIEKQRDLNKALEEHGKGSFAAEKASAALGNARELLQKATEGTIPPLTQQQKVLAASSAIFQQTGVAQGDFARTSDGLANQQRRLKARFEDAKAELGQGLLPIMTDAADFILDKGLPAFEKFSDWFTKEGVPKLKEFGGFIRDDVAPPLKDAAGFASDLVGWMNKISKDVKLGGLLGAAALFGGAKLRGGRGGLLGTAGSALGISKPIPVLVTNPGFGGSKPTPGTTTTTAPDSKTKPGAKPRRGGGGALLAIAALSPWMADEFQAEYEFQKKEWDKYVFNPSTTKFPQQLKGLGGKEGLASLLLGPMNKYGEAKGQIRSLGDEWIVTGSKADRANERMANQLFHFKDNVKQGQDRVHGLDRDLQKLSMMKPWPEVKLRGIDKARQQVNTLQEDLNVLAAFDPTGVAGLAALGQQLSSRESRRNRRRNLGGIP